MKRIMLISFIMIILLVLCGFSSQHEEKYEAISTNFKIMLSDQSITLDEPILAVNNKAYIPVRNFANSIGFDVDWKDEERTIELNDSMVRVENEISEYTTAVALKKETAIAIAEAVAIELFPEILTSKYVFIAEGDSYDVWTVHGWIDPPEGLIEGKFHRLLGPHIIIEINKNSGRIVGVTSPY